MSIVADDIRFHFNRRKNLPFVAKRNEPICKENPFTQEFWMYYYLFPEVLMVAEEARKEECNVDPGNIEVITKYLETCSDIYGIIYFPCWLLPESEVLRIMTECGIL